MLISSVETHIQEAEAEMLSSEEKLDIWEQALLQEAQDETVSWLDDISCKSVSLNKLLVLFAHYLAQTCPNQPCV